MMWNYNLGWGGWLVMSLAMIAFWGVVVFAIVALFRGASAAAAPPARRVDAERLLDERFARGEINEQEYRARQDVLHATGSNRRLS